MIKNNWYQKIENNIEQEAGMQENTIVALMVLSILGISWKMVDTVSNQYNIPKETIVEKITVNSPEVQQIKEIIKTKDINPKSKQIVQKVQQDVREIKQKQNNAQQKTTIIVSNKIVNTVIDLEGPKSDSVSKQGASGIMQIMRRTWEEINKEKHNGQYPYDQFKFNKEINTMFGREYLEKLAKQLETHKSEWKADPYFLLFAAYNTGPGHVQECKYDEKLILQNHPDAHDYATRGMNLLGSKIK